jgi:hypothetical protein
MTRSFDEPVKMVNAESIQCFNIAAISSGCNRIFLTDERPTSLKRDRRSRVVLRKAWFSRILNVDPAMLIKICPYREYSTTPTQFVS